MEFDKTKVYTALNADELKAGDIVFVANYIVDLRHFVESDMMNAKRLVKIDDESKEFRFWTENKYRFAYLVEHAPKKYFRPFKDTNQLIECWTQKMGYKAKPCTMPLIWVKSKTNGYVDAVVGFSFATVSIKSCACVISMDELFNNYTFLDDLPCGIQTFFDK